MSDRLWTKEIDSNRLLRLADVPAGISQDGLIAAAFIALLLGTVFTCSAFLGSTAKSQYISNFPGEKINPNTASVPSLMRLPGIGLTKAEAIAQYRSKYQQQGGTSGQKAFHNSHDMTAIKGIGKKTVERMKDLLCFD